MRAAIPCDSGNLDLEANAGHTIQVATAAVNPPRSPRPLKHVQSSHAIRHLLIACIMPRRHRQATSRCWIGSHARQVHQPALPRRRMQVHQDSHHSRASR
jgi:hypothetical protein